MNQEMISKQETKSVINNTGMYQQTKTWIHNQKRVFSIQVHCGYCHQSYNAHNNTFKKHLSTQKHKDNRNAHLRFCQQEFERFINGN